MTAIHQAAYLCCHANFNVLFVCILHLKYCIYLFNTSSALKLMLWRLDTLLLIGKINTSIWFCCMKKNLMDDKRNEAQRPHTCWNPNLRNISLTSGCREWGGGSGTPSGKCRLLNLQQLATSSSMANQMSDFSVMYGTAQLFKAHIHLSGKST